MIIDGFEDEPFGADTAAAQCAALLDVLGPAPKHVLDLGCGSGRLLLPLVDAGHVVVGVDRRADALAACRSALDEADASALLLEGDFTKLDRDAITGAFDAVLCLGNTFMTIPNVDDAVHALMAWRELLKPEGMVILDDLPHEHWPEITEGFWTAGTTEDASAQIVWHPTDALFTLRLGERVNPDDETLGDDDRVYRLWTDGALRLAARLAGLSAAVRHDSRTLLIMRPGA